MPKDINAVSLFGNATRFELKYTPTGMAVLDLCVAGEETIVKADGKTAQIPFYFNTSVLGKPAEEFVTELSEDGTSIVHIAGELEHRKWVDGQGKEQQRLFIRAENAQLVVKPDAVGFSQDSQGNKRLKGGWARATVSGRVVTDNPELRTTKGAGDYFMNLRTNVRGRPFKTAEGKWETPPNWTKMTLWRDDAKAAHDLGVTKGNEFFVEGRLQMGQDWQDGEGNKRKGEIELSPTKVTWLVGRGSTGAPRTPVAAPTWEPAGADAFSGSEDDAPF